MKKSREIKVIKRYILQILFCRKRNFLPLFQAFEIYYHDMQKVWRRCWKNPLKTKPKTCHSNCIVYVCKKPSIRNVCLTQILISVLQRIVFHVSVPSIIMWTKLGFYLLHALSFFLSLLPIPQSSHCDNPRPNQIYFDNTSFSFTKWFSYI